MMSDVENAQLVRCLRAYIDRENAGRRAEGDALNLLAKWSETYGRKKQLAKLSGVTGQFIGDLAHQRRNLRPHTAAKIIQALEQWPDETKGEGK